LENLFNEIIKGYYYHSSLLEAVIGGILRNIFQGSLLKGLEDIKKVGDIINKNLLYPISIILLNHV